MLYNFYDSPEDLYERMKLNILLNEELGIRIFSFPMRYQPVDLKDRSHIGKKWNKYMLRSMQLILQATHGIVSGAPDFFRHAFGDSETEYRELLTMPHKFIFNRSWFEELGGKSELEQFKLEYSKLSESSSPRICLLTADWLRFKMCPAPVKLPVSATTWKILSLSQFIQQRPFSSAQRILT